LEEVLGVDRVLSRRPVMGGEDFGQYGRTEHKVPVCMFYVGAVAPDRFRSGQPIPSTHSPFFAPEPESTLRTGVRAMTHAALLLLGAP
jgi:hippurate hydrolase